MIKVPATNAWLTTSFEAPSGTVLFVRNLETSQRFLSPRLAAEQAQTQEGNRTANVAQVTVPGGVQFEILSGYNPLPAKPAKEIAAKDGEDETAKNAAKSAGMKKAGPAVKGSLPKAGVRKAPAQTGAPR